MSKKIDRFNDFDMQDDQYSDRAFYKEMEDRRRLKRMKNAIRSKNVNALLQDLDDDYDEYW